MAVYRSRTFKYISNSSRFKDAQLEQYFQLGVLTFDSRFNRFRFEDEFYVETNDIKTLNTRIWFGDFRRQGKEKPTWNFRETRNRDLWCVYFLRQFESFSRLFRLEENDDHKTHKICKRIFNIAVFTAERFCKLCGFNAWIYLNMYDKNYPSVCFFAKRSLKYCAIVNDVSCRNMYMFLMTRELYEI